RALWPRIVEDARVKSPMLGALLQATEIAELDGNTLAIRLRDTNPVHVEGIERQRDAVALLVGRYTADPIRIRLETAARGDRRARHDPRDQDRSPSGRAGGHRDARGPRPRRRVAGAAARRRAVPGGSQEARLGPAVVSVSTAAVVRRVGYRGSRDGARPAPRDRA